jgi:hypothetical protein
LASARTESSSQDFGVEQFFQADDPSPFPYYPITGQILKTFETYLSTSKVVNVIKDKKVCFLSGKILYLTFNSTENYFTAYIQTE